MEKKRSVLDGHLRMSSDTLPGAIDMHPVKCAIANSVDAAEEEVERELLAAFADAGEAEPTYSEQQAKIEAPPAPQAKSAPATAKILLMMRHLAIQWLDGWGAVIKEREITKDPTALPKNRWSVNGGTRGKPSNVPGIFDVYCDIEHLLAEYEKDIPPAIGVRAMLKFAHCDCVSHETTMMGILFKDGTTAKLSKEQLAKQPPEPALVAEYIPVVKRVSRLDWEKFRMPASIGGHETYGLNGVQVIDAAYRDFKRQLVKTRGLELIAIDHLERGIRIQVQ